MFGQLLDSGCDFPYTTKHNFDVNFSFSERDNSGWGVTVRKFDIDEKSIDLGHSDKIFSLGGTEKP